MDMEVSDGEYEILKTIPCPSLPYNTPGTTYVLVKIPDDQTEGMVRFTSQKRHRLDASCIKPVDFIKLHRL